MPPNKCFPTRADGRWCWSHGAYRPPARAWYRRMNQIRHGCAYAVCRVRPSGKLGPGAVAVGDGETTVAAERPGRDLDARRCLAALVLAVVHQPDHTSHGLAVVAQIDDHVLAAIL